MNSFTDNRTLKHVKPKYNNMATLSLYILVACTTRIFYLYHNIVKGYIRQKVFTSKYIFIKFIIVLKYNRVSMQIQVEQFSFGVLSGLDQEGILVKWVVVGGVLQV